MSEETNRTTYENPSIAQHYAEAEGLTPTESQLFEASIHAHTHVLDLGIGGGRTTRALASRAKNYIGIDFSSAMIEASRKKFPNLDLRVMDASDLGAFSSEQFDVVVFSFNGMDNIYPLEKRQKCMEEVYRVLKKGGVYIFSCHHSQRLLQTPELTGVSVPKKVWRLAYALGKSASLIFHAAKSSYFWKRKGYAHETVHGGLVTFQTTPEFVREECKEVGFELISTHRTNSIGLSIAQPWYYYVARKP